MGNSVFIIVIAAVAAIIIGFVVGRVIANRMVKAEQAKLDEQINQAKEKARMIELEARDKGYKIQKDLKPKHPEGARSFHAKRNVCKNVERISISESRDSNNANKP